MSEVVDIIEFVRERVVKDIDEQINDFEFAHVSLSFLVGNTFAGEGVLGLGLSDEEDHAAYHFLDVHEVRHRQLLVVVLPYAVDKLLYYRNARVDEQYVLHF